MKNTSGPLSQEKQHQDVYKAAVVQILLFSSACFMLLYAYKNKIFTTLYIPFCIILPFSPALAAPEFFARGENFAVSGGNWSRWTHCCLNMPGDKWIEWSFI